MKYDLIVVGGGLAGAALAVALRRSRLRIALLESAVPTRTAGWDARIYAYSPASAEFLTTLGVWTHLDRDRLCPVHRMQVFGDSGGQLTFSAYDSGLPELAWIGESGLVHAELWESLKRQHNVTILCPARPVELQVDDACARIRLEDGRMLEAQLVVGADGRESWVRTQAGIGASVRPYDEMAVVANFECEQSHRNTAFQWFGENGVLAWLPLPGRLMSMVWSAKDACAERLLALDDQAFCEHVAGAGGNRLGALALQTPRAAFPLRLMKVEKFVASRIALVGDAAHAIHPLSGHGINLGFQDARVLAGKLEALAPWQDAGELGVLRAYARERAEESFLLQNATDGLSRLFDIQDPLVAALRNTGLNLTDRFPVVTNALIRYATSGRF